MSAPQIAASSAIRPSQVVQSRAAGISAWSLLLLLIIVNFAMQPPTEPDFGWHLRTGMDVLRLGLPLPAADPYSHTMPDWRWVEHAWLTDVLVAGIYSTFGALPVICFFAAVTISAWLIGAAVASASVACRWLACAISLWVALPYLGARTQFITLLGLAVLSWLLKRSHEGNRAAQWWIPPLFVLWANLHGGFVAGLLLLGLVIGTSAVVRWLADRQMACVTPCDEPLYSWTDLKRLTVISAISACVTLLNPYGWRLYAEIVDSLSNRFMLDTLQEWQPLSLSTLAGRRYALYLAGLGIGTVLWYRRIQPVRWVVGAVFLAFSVRHMRNIPFFLVVSLPLCAEVLSDGYAAVRGRWPCEDIVMKKVSLAAALLMAAILVWEGPDHVQRIVLSGTRPVEYFKTTSYPIEAVEWMQAHPDQTGHRLYNDYGYGGFLLWWMPGTKIFIDGRMPAWRTGERSILRDYMALTGENPDLSVLGKYSVDWALVRSGTPLDATLARQPGWNRVYEDQKAAIYRLAATTSAF